MPAHAIACLSLLLLPAPGLAGAAAKPRVDAHGFPLPDGALRRLGDMRFGQDGDLGALTVSPDGKLVASTGHHVYLWDAESGRIVRELGEPPAGDALVFSRNGQWLAAEAPSCHVMIWNVRTGKAAWPDRDRTAKAKPQISALRFIQDDELLAVAHVGGPVRLWHVADGTLAREWTPDRLPGFRAEHTAVAVVLSPSGSQMAWLARQGAEQSGHRTVLLYDTRSGKLLRTVKAAGHPDRLHLLDEGSTLLLQEPGVAFPNNGGGNAVVDAADGRERFRFPTRVLTVLGAPIGYRPCAHFLAMFPDGRSFFTVDEAGIVRRDLASGRPLTEIARPCFSMAFDGGGGRVAAAYGERWEWCDNQLRPLRTCTDFSRPPSLRYLDNDRLLLTGDRPEGGRANPWDLRTGKLVRTVRTLHHPRDGIFRAPCDHDPWGERFVYHKDKHVLVCDLVADRVVCRLAGIGPITGHENTVNLRFSANGKRVLVSGPNQDVGLVRWFDSETGVELGRYRIPKAKLYPGMQTWAEWYADDGTVFGYYMPDSRLVLVDCRRRAESLVFGIPMPPPAADRKAFSPEWQFERTVGDAVILAYRDDDAVRGQREFTVWERATGRLLRHFTLRPNGKKPWHFPRMALSPDGRIVLCRRLGTSWLAVYETATGRQRGWLRLPITASDFAFAPDGRTLAITESTTALIWDLQRPFGDQPPLLMGSTAAEHARLWHQLGDRDPAVAEMALWALVRAPKQAVSLLRARLRTVAADQTTIVALVAKLDGETFDERERALRELAELGELAYSALRAAQGHPRSVEQRRRIEQLLTRLEALDLSPRLAELRAVEVLQRIGSSDARQLLQTLASGSPDAALTREARLAVHVR